MQSPKIHWTVAVFLLALVVVFPASSRAEGAPDEALRAPTADEIPLIQQTLEAEALLILDAAAAHARRHDGNYPATVADFAAALPRTALDNLFDGDPAVASRDIDVPRCSVVYVPLRDADGVAGCEILIVGWDDERMAVVSDGSVWRELRARPILAAAEIRAAR